MSWLRAGDETVFQRLYDDGLIRVARLEKLREKVRKERSKLGYADKEEARRRMKKLKLNFHLSSLSRCVSECSLQYSTLPATEGCSTNMYPFHSFSRDHVCAFQASVLSTVEQSDLRGW